MGGIGNVGDSAFLNVQLPPAGEGGQGVQQGGGALNPLLDPAAIREILVSVAPMLRNASVEALTDTNKSIIKELCPEIDPAELDDLSRDMADLEALVALFTLEEDEAQAKALADRIKTKTEEMERRHAEVIDKIKQSVEKAVEAEKAQDRSKVFGWVTMSLSIFAAVVAVASTALTGGGSLAIAACVFTCLSALFTTTQQILEATDVVKDSIEDRAKDIAAESNGKITIAQARNKLMKEYQIGMAIANGVLGLTSICFSIGGTVNAFKAAADTVKTAAKISESLSKAAKITQVITQILGLGTGITGTVFAWKDTGINYDAAKADAEVKKLRALLDKLHQAIEEEQSKLNEILLKIQDSISVVLSILTKPLEGLDDILQHIEIAD